jgi:hypothetical protein
MYLPNPHSPQYQQIASARFEAFGDTMSRCSPPPHQGMTISHSEHGGNGVSRGVVNQWLPRKLLRQIISQVPNFDLGKNSF